MQSGEFPHNKPDNSPASGESDIKALLNTLSIEDAEALCNSLHRQTIDEWERCSNSFGALFARLNMYNTRDLDLFDIPIDKDEESSNEIYMRVWKEKDGSYNTSHLVRNNGQIIERTKAEKFSDTYLYQFGPGENHIATLVIQPEATGMQVVKSNGNLESKRTRLETDTLVTAFETVVLPSIERSRSNLATIWGAIQRIEQ